jgi:hypothetical protein
MARPILEYLNGMEWMNEWIIYKPWTQGPYAWVFSYRVRQITLGIEVFRTISITNLANMASDSLYLGKRVPTQFAHMKISNWSLRLFSFFLLLLSMFVLSLFKTKLNKQCQHNIFLAFSWFACLPRFVLLSHLKKIFCSTLLHNCKSK